ncbi:DNA internalization-related competence protein ComEC/Rec2 [Aquibacillus kalidii]|uniref:DNA internalization-related competence protein ComEC/Rec2 n=1 Tax=Aquibacillus kalidii TaxID=2762597 RepID=UPI0016488638|nr:DNA internalization-related competence protein ComEC/Rec2 [Aquibacillus kalidii]
MKGNNHLFVLSAITSALSASFHNTIFSWCWIGWLVYLVFAKGLQKRVFVSLMIAIVFLNVWNKGLLVDPSLKFNSSSISNTVVGKIISPVSISSKAIQFTLKPDQVNDKTLVVVYSDQIQSENQYSQLKAGANCTINGLPQPLDRKTNPGQFDYGGYLEKQGITSELIVKDPQNVYCTGASTINQLYLARTTVIQKAQEELSPSTASWISALILGDDQFLSDDTIELFQKWGLSHLLAISGLHVGLIVSSIYFSLIKLQLLTREKAQWFVIICLPFYAILAGGAPSVWRASLLTFLALIITKVKIKLTTTDMLGVVFLLLILIKPENMYHLGFQFSFLITYCLLLSKSFIQNQSRFFSILTISFLSLLTLLPLQLYNFYYFNPLSILINLLYVPYFSFIVMPLLLVITLSLIFPFPFSFVDQMFQNIHHFAMIPLENIDKTLFYPWITGKFPLLMFIPYFVVFILFMNQLSRSNKSKAFYSGCLLVVILLAATLKPYISSSGYVTTLDVGQGDAIVVELPHRKGVILIDVAGTLQANFKSPSDKVYRQVIKPYLLSRGISSIDAVFLSHEDHDHIGSLPYLLGDFKVGKLITSEYFTFSQEAKKILEQKRIEHITLSTGEEFVQGNQHFYVLSPINNNGSTNENSLVLFSKIGGLTWLFTGDINTDIESELVTKYPNLTIDVLKVAHHGSNSSSANSFIETVSPKYALISVGDNNRYGHPHLEVINSLEQEGVSILRTDQVGAIQYQFRSNQLGTFTTQLP